MTRHTHQPRLSLISESSELRAAPGVRHLLNLADVSAAEIERIFAIASDLRSKYERGLREPMLPGRVMALLFDKPSLRTRVSFEAAMIQLGGGSLMLGADSGWGARESAADFGRVLTQYVDVLVVRTHRHAGLVDLAAHCECPVINGLTDEAHPCQALADLYTLRTRFGRLADLQITFVGDGNNVARCLARGAVKLGMRFVLAAPRKYWFSPEFMAELSDSPTGSIEQTEDAQAAVGEALAVYTDVWTSMGQESERERRMADLSPYQVNAALLAAAPPEAVFLHCLPARRGEEVTDEVIDGPQSAVIEQAANRMHVQKGILAWLLAANARGGS